MGRTVQLDEETVALVDAWVADGEFASPEEAIRYAVASHAGSRAFPAEIDGAWIDAKLAEAEADVAAGRVRPAEDVFADLLARFLPLERHKAG